MSLFKEFHYNINLTPVQTISKIKSVTIFSKRASTNKDEFKGEFKDNSFRVYFILSDRNSFNPNFYGKAEAADNYTRLSITMRPNIATYFGLAAPFILLLVSIFVLIYQKDFRCFLAMSLLFLGFIVFILGSLHMKLSDMRYVIEKLFVNDML